MAMAFSSFSLAIVRYFARFARSTSGMPPTTSGADRTATRLSTASASCCLALNSESSRSGPSAAWPAKPALSSSSATGGGACSRSSCFVPWREVLALEVLADRELRGRVVVNAVDHRGNGVHAGGPRRAPSSLAGDQLEAMRAKRPDQDRLQDAMLTDGGRQFVQRT